MFAFLSMKSAPGSRSLLLASLLLAIGAAGCAGQFDDYYAVPEDGGADAMPNNPDGAVDGGDDGAVDSAVDMNTPDFGSGPFDVNLVVGGTGSGSVISSPEGISCGSDCMETFASGTSIILVASRGSNEDIVWGGACASATGNSCALTVDRPLDVTIDFNTPTYTLTVNFDGGATGTVVAADESLNCDGTGVCSAEYIEGTEVTLSAEAAQGAAFMGWSVDCAGSGDCVLTMNEDKTVGATFDDSALVALLVSKSGTGSGTVTSDPAGVDCGATCSGSYDPGTMVTLTAVADANSTFTSWSGDCTGTGLTCTVAMSASRNVTARFTINEYTVTAVRAGTGTGTVRSSPLLIDCGSECSATYTHGTTVALFAEAESGTSQFTGWSGACSGTSSLCEIVLTDDATATATFVPNRYTLNTSVNGPGSINSTNPGIACGTDCTQDYDHGTMVTLNATADEGATFTSWTGACSTEATSTCVVTMTQAATVGANFTLNQYTINAATTDDGAGTITSSVGGINCGDGNTACSATVNHGTMVTFTATAADGSTFIGWGGACSAATGNMCTIEITAATDVSAAFIIGNSSLSITKNGPGTVTSEPAGINCGGTCASSFLNGTTVTLTAVPDTGATFSGFSGGGCVTDPLITTCDVLVDSAVNVTATFVYDQHVLTVNAGDGGTVTSGAGDITCGSGGADCTQILNYGSVRTLSAVSDENYVFLGWSGGSCEGTGTCVVEITGDVTITADFQPVQRLLTVQKGGTGTGTVVDNLNRISCGATCMAEYDNNTMVTLTATASSTSNFIGWNVESCGTNLQCTVTMDQAQTVNATFTLKQYTLTVLKSSGNASFPGTGTVTSVPTGINCGSECSNNYSHGTQVTLSASASSNSTFVEWSGANCTGNEQCVVDMTQARTVTASFVRNQHVVTVNLAGVGTGSVTSNPTGLTCTNGVCTGTFYQGQSVTLTPVAGTGSVFGAWTGCTPGQNNACTLTVGGATELTARFDVAVHTLGVSIEGGGTGSVTSPDTAIQCDESGGQCATEYDYGTVVTLNATETGASTFQGWTGPCEDPNSTTCSFTMTGDETVQAVFVSGNVLTVSIDDDAGGGGINITSTPAGISCSADGGVTTGICSAEFAQDEQVSLTPTFDTASTVFVGWSGGGCTGNGECIVTMDMAKTVTASFAYRSFTVGVELSDPAMGFVLSGESTPLIQCPESTCSASYTYGSVVELQANPNEGFNFDSWEGCDAVEDNICFLEITADRSVFASFVPQFHTVTVTNPDPDAGRVASNTLAGIECGTDCSEAYPTNTVLELVAEASFGYNFVGWNDPYCQGQGPSCFLTITGPVNVEPIWEPVLFPVTVRYTNFAEGDVQDLSGAISCGVDGDPGCTALFPYGSQVTLTANNINVSGTVVTGSEFQRWDTSGGPCASAGTSASCSFTVQGAATAGVNYLETYRVRIEISSSLTLQPSVIVRKAPNTPFPRWEDVGTCTKFKLSSGICNYGVPVGWGVSVEASPTGATGFNRWGPTPQGCGTTENPCVFGLNNPLTVGADFD